MSTPAGWWLVSAGAGHLSSNQNPPWGLSDQWESGKSATAHCRALPAGPGSGSEDSSDQYSAVPGAPRPGQPQHQSQSTLTRGFLLRHNDEFGKCRIMKIRQTDILMKYFLHNPALIFSFCRSQVTLTQLTHVWESRREMCSVQSAEWEVAL